MEERSLPECLEKKKNPNMTKYRAISPVRAGLCRVSCRQHFLTQSGRAGTEPCGRRAGWLQTAETKS